MVSKTLIKYVLTAAMRDRLMVTLVLFIILGSSISIFMGSAAISEQHAFAVVFGAGGLRFLGVLGLVLFVSFYMRRAFDHKEVEFLLSRPISRTSFLLSHMLAFMFLAVLIGAAVTAALALMGRPDIAGLAMWGGSIIVEFAIMSSAALFFSMALSSAAGSALACVGLYVLARMIGVLLGIADLPAENTIFMVLGWVMEIISIIIPRLDLMGQTSWLVYGPSIDASIEATRYSSEHALKLIQALGLTGFIVVQGVIFVFLLMAASAYDFVRKQF